MNERFKCVPLTSNSKHLNMIREFTIDREQEDAHIPDKIIGLEAYLKRAAWQEDLDEKVKIYLIIDTILDEVAAYFGLKAGMVVDNEEGEPSAEEKEEAFLFAANDEEDKEKKLIKYYERVFGFRLSGLDDFYMPLQPGYDGGCKFMYRIRYSSEG